MSGAGTTRVTIRDRFRARRRAEQRRQQVVLRETGSEALVVGACAAVLVVLGIVMVFNTSYFFALDRFGDPYLFTRRQVAAACLGLVVVFLGARIPLAWYRKATYPLLLLSTVLLALVLVPGVGVEGGGAQRWLPVFGWRFQPSELAKLAVVLYLAHSLAKKGDRVRELGKGYLPHLVVVGAVAALVVAEPDFGTAVLLAGVLFVLLFVAGARIQHLAASFGVVAPIAIWFVLTAEYRLARVMAFLDPWQDARRSGFQLVQSFLAFGSGGFLGVGLGRGQQKMFYLPGAHTDFVFSVIGEELGFVGALAVVLLFVAFAAGGFWIAWIHPDPYASFLALGLTMLVVLQASINMGVATGVLPTKGIALPFLSYGGSALLTNLAMVGILLSVTRPSR